MTSMKFQYIFSKANPNNHEKTNLYTFWGIIVALTPKERPERVYFL